MEIFVKITNRSVYFTVWPLFRFFFMNILPVLRQQVRMYFCFPDNLIFSPHNFEECAFFIS